MKKILAKIICLFNKHIPEQHPLISHSDYDIKVFVYRCERCKELYSKIITKENVVDKNEKNQG